MDAAVFVAARVGGEGAVVFPDFPEGVFKAFGAATDRIGLRFQPRIVLHQFWDIGLFFHTLSKGGWLLVGNRKRTSGQPNLKLG